MILCTNVSGPLVRAFQFHSQTLVGPLLSVWSDLTGTDDFRESSTRYATFSDGSSISLGQNKKAKENTSHIIISPHVMLSGFQNPGNFCLWNPESGKFLLVEFRIREIFACGIQNTRNFGLSNPESGKSLLVEFRIREIFACGIQNPGNFCLRNPDSGKFLLVESTITGNICLWNPQSGILGFKIRNPAQEIQNPAIDWNPEFKFCWQGIWNSVLGIRNRQCGIQNSRLIGLLDMVRVMT